MSLACLTSLASHAAQGATWDSIPQATLDERWPVLSTRSLDTSSLDRGSGGKQDWSLAAEADAFAGSGVLRLLRAEEDLPRLHPSRSKEHAMAGARALVSASSSSWEVSAFVRQFFTGSARDGALQIVRSYAAREQLPEGKSLALDARLRLMDQRGVGLARSWPISLSAGSTPLQITVGTQFFRLAGFAEFSSEGQILRSENQYDFGGTASYRDSRRVFEGYGQSGSQGQGAGIDLSLAWQPNDRSMVLASIVNAWSLARIAEVASQELRLRSDARIVDDQGFLISQPSIEGKYSAKNLNVRLAPVTSVAFAHTWAVSEIMGLRSTTGLPLITTGVRLQRTDALDLRSAWASAPVALGCYAVAEYEFRFGSKGLGLRCGWGQVILRSDASNPQAAKSLGMSFALFNRFSL